MTDKSTNGTKRRESGFVDREKRSLTTNITGNESVGSSHKFNIVRQ